MTKILTYMFLHYKSIKLCYLAFTVVQFRTHLCIVCTPALNPPKTDVFQCPNPTSLWIIPPATRNPINSSRCQNSGTKFFCLSNLIPPRCYIKLLSGAFEYFGQVCLYSDRTVLSVLSPLKTSQVGV